jgi:hypothetical protein
MPGPAPELDRPSRREGARPKWPLVRPTRRELTLWADYWQKPQALIWERNQSEIEVALHVRTLVEAEGRRVWEQKGASSLRKLVRDQQNSLLLTADSLARARYVIEGSAPAIEALARQFAMAAAAETAPDEELAEVPVKGVMVDWAAEKSRMGVN